jgi:hypothetical protein
MNQAAVALVERTLPHGLPHPGDANRPPFLVPLPGFRTTGMTDEQARELVGQGAKTTAEALVALLESEFVLRTKAEDAQLVQRAADAPDGTRILKAHRGTKSGPVVCELVIDKTDDVVLPEAILREAS